MSALRETYTCNTEALQAAADVCFTHLYWNLEKATEPCHLTRHYENTPMQYTAIFHGSKNDNFQMKNCDIFLILAQNTDYGYTLEPPHLRRF